MKNKKFISLVMALAMIFSMSVSVFASNGGTSTGSAGAVTDPNTFTATATVKIPAISVTVPDAEPLFINPMGFQVKIATGAAADSDDDETTSSTSKIVSPLFTIDNDSPMELDVNVIGSVSAVKKVGNAETATMSISATQIAETDTKNSVFIYAQFGAVNEAGDAFATEPTAYDPPAADAPSFPQLALTTKAPAKPVNVGTIASGADDTTFLGFQFRGDCNANAKNEWVSGESVDVTLIFSFKPHVEASGTTVVSS